MKPNILYKYTNAQIAKIILINHTLRFSSPFLFNDPFDIYPILKCSFSRSDLAKAMFEEIEILIKEGNYRNFNLNSNVSKMINLLLNSNNEKRNRIKKEFTEIVEDIEIDEYPVFNELQEKWLEIIPKNRILCLSALNDNPVMWTFYSDNYKGVVIELDTNEYSNNPLCLIKEVNYSDELPRINNLRHIIRTHIGIEKFDFNKIFHSFEHTKTNNWKFEEEWRIVSFNKHNTELYDDYKIDPKFIKCIYFGINMNNEDKEDLLKLKFDELNHLKFYEMNLNKKKRKIEFSQVS
ncbi:MAG: DUF2971 domain-containing protein [Candidatus Lokiarchaeota archaeon]|nr:DUF2971 domain-containing protein [Candidatus Lokiarchaeota archaeon]